MAWSRSGRSGRCERDRSQAKRGVSPTSECRHRRLRRHRGSRGAGQLWKLLAFIAARTGDVAGAEDALSEAFAIALTDWPACGVPDNPQAWILTVARRKLIDACPAQTLSREASTHLRLLAEEAAAEPEADIPDDRLALMFVCAHRAIDPAVRAPLMLQTVLGLDAATIASAFLTAPSAMGQRLVRAKARIKLAAIPFRLPERPTLPERLQAVLEAIYAAFSAGWTDPSVARNSAPRPGAGGHLSGRLVVSLLPDEPEALGLLALMLYAEAAPHRPAYRGGRLCAAGGTSSRGLGCGPDRASRGAAAARQRAIGRVGGSNWRPRCSPPMWSVAEPGDPTGRQSCDCTILWTALTGSPVVAINRAVALAETAGACRDGSARNWTHWPMTRDLRLINHIGPRGPGCWHGRL